MLTPSRKTISVITAAGLVIICQGLGPLASALSEEPWQPLPIEVIVRGKAFPSVTAYRNAEASQEAFQEDSKRALEENVEPAMGLIPGKAAPDGVSAGPVSEQPQGSEVDKRGWKTLRVAPRTDMDKILSVVASDTLLVPNGDDSSSSSNAEGINFVAGVSPAVAEMVEEFQDHPEVAMGRVERVQTSQELGEKLTSQADKVEGPLLLISDGRKVKLMDLKDVSGGKEAMDMASEEVGLDKTGVSGP